MSTVNKDLTALMTIVKLRYLPILTLLLPILRTLAFIKMVNQTVPVGLHDDLRLVVSCVECHVIIRDLREINLL